MSSLFIDAPHLVFQIHANQQDGSLDFRDADVGIIRDLAKAYAEIAALPVQKERMQMWRRLNDLEPERPLIWTNEVCWNEMNHDGSLTLQCTNEVCRRIELDLRRTIYQWKHFPGDMVVAPIYYSPTIIENTGFGIEVEAEVSVTDPSSEVASRHFHNQLRSEEDIDRIRPPVIVHSVERTRAFHSAYRSLFDGIMPVEVRGCTGFWFAPWDDIVFWMGANDVLMNLATKPDFMHRLVRRLVDAYLVGLDRFLELDLLSPNSCNVRIGSGAYGYTAQLPQADFSSDAVRPIDLWGSATPQLFGSVSPEMHDEFGVSYEIEWLSRFGLSYYGCCEPLHNKLDVLARIPNLRKVSTSPWADVPAMAEDIRGKYVMSLKPNPSYLAAPTFDLEFARSELKRKLDAARGCNVEIVLKDLSTVARQPQRIWHWIEMAQKLVREYD